MSATLTRRGLMQGLLGSGAALASAPLWASADQEQQVADAWWEAYLSGKHEKLPRHPDREAERALQAIAAPLCKISTRSNLKWRVGLLKVNPRDINAFTVGGGVIFVHDALLPFCSGESELAAVLGHEIGHVEHRHSIKRMYAEQVLSRHGIESGHSPALLAEALRRNMHLLVADSVIFRSYTRHWEYQSDAFAVRSLDGTGYDTSQAHVIFERLLEVQPDSGDVNTCLASTHPEFADRIQRMQALSKQYGRRSARPDSGHFRTLLRLAS